MYCFLRNASHLCMVITYLYVMHFSFNLSNSFHFVLWQAMLYLGNLKGERGDAESETIEEVDCSDEVCIADPLCVTIQY